MLTFGNDNFRLNFKLPTPLLNLEDSKIIVQIDIKINHCCYTVKIWIFGYDNGMARVYKC